MSNAVRLDRALKQDAGSVRSQSTQVEMSRAQSEVQAMVVVAQRMPRSESAARNRVLETCKMMGLAERAFFKFPRGGQSVAGPTIHLAVELARCWGNINYGIKELDRDDELHVSEMVAFAWDLETNVRAETAFIVPHLRDKRGGPEILVDMRDIYENNANMGARRLREMIFRCLPPWLVEDAKAACMVTLEKGGADPLPVQISNMVSAFEKIGINKARIEAKTGLQVDAMQSIDLANLRVSFNSIQRGEISASEEFPPLQASNLTNALTGPAETPQAEVKPEPEAKPAETAKADAKMTLERAKKLGADDAVKGDACDPDRHKIPTGAMAQAYIKAFDDNAFPGDKPQGGLV